MTSGTARAKNHMKETCLTQTSVLADLILYHHRNGEWNLEARRHTLLTPLFHFCCLQTAQGGRFEDTAKFWRLQSLPGVL